MGLAGVGFGRTAQYYGGSAIAGSGTGALMDTGIQSAEWINYDINGGITGRSEYDLGQIAFSSVVGGVAFPLLGAIPAFLNSKYNLDLQSPIYFDVSAGRLNSGLPIEFRCPIIKEADSVLINSEIAALQRIATNNKSDLYWGSLRRAYQDARGQIDFAHIEADIDFSQVASKQVMGGHFSTSPLLKIIEGTEQIGQNGSIQAKVELLTIDGNFYTKTNNGGYSSMTLLTWSLAQAKGEMSLAWLNRSLVSGKTYEGKSGGLSFKFFLTEL